MTDRIRQQAGHRAGPGPIRLTGRDATFQQWQALLTNRTKRQRAGAFLVHGVRPITLAAEHHWPLRALLHTDTPHRSQWADALLAGTHAARYALPAALLAELGDFGDHAPELIAVAAIPPDEPSRIPVGPRFLGVAFDRPASPGNIGTMVRSADAFGATGLLVTGHAADPYDPKAVRASTGSLFALPVVRTAGPQAVLDHLAAAGAAGGRPVTVLGAEADGDTDIDDVDLTGPTLLVIGNETRGLSRAWRDACDHTVRIPIGGAASSLNAAAAATAALYEAARQRRRARPGGPAPAPVSHQAARTAHT